MWTMLMQMIPSAVAIGQGDCETSRTRGARTFVAPVAFTCRDPLQRVRLSIGGLEDEISGSFSQNGRRARPSRRDFEDDPLRRQDITKDAENETAIAQCCGGMLTGVVDRPHAFPELGPQVADWASVVASENERPLVLPAASPTASNSIATFPFSEIRA